MNNLLLSTALMFCIPCAYAQAKTSNFKCKDFFEVLPSTASSVTHKLRIKRTGTTPDHVYACIGRHDLKGRRLGGLNHNGSLKKDQILKLPKSWFVAFSPWGLEYQFSQGSIKSTGPSRTIDVMGHTLFARYSYTFKKKYDFIFWGGLKQMNAELTSPTITSKRQSEAAIVGQMRVKFNYNGEWSYYGFGSFDRYAVSDFESVTTGKQAFIYKIETGFGVEKLWNSHFLSRLDGGIIYPSSNSSNNLNSGFEVGLEIEYKWKNWLAIVRGNYLNFDTDSGSDSGFINTFKIGYGF
jgi:hypothetical protein